MKKGSNKKMLSSDKDFDGISGNNHPTIYYALSTDEKPVNKVINGAVLIEMDTSKVYFFNKTSSEWLEWGETSSSINTLSISSSPSLLTMNTSRPVDVTLNDISNLYPEYSEYDYDEDQ